MLLNILLIFFATLCTTWLHVLIQCTECHVSDLTFITIILRNKTLFYCYGEIIKTCNTHMFCSSHTITIYQLLYNLYIIKNNAIFFIHLELHLLWNVFTL